MLALLFLLDPTRAGEPPCGEITSENFLEGDHFWVQWDEAVGDADTARDNLTWAEEARRVYIDEFGYAFTDKTILIRVTDSDVDAGLATTVACADGKTAPLLTLYATGKGQPGRGTTMHEVAHAAQYAYMGTYIDGVKSWPWWMEANASWITSYSDGSRYTWGRDAEAYLEAPWIGLHQTQLAYLDPELALYLYGVGVLVQHLEDAHGADAVRATWEYGATVAGEPIYFPDAIAAAGIDWEEFWHGWMAAVTVLDISHAGDLTRAVEVEERVGSLPAEGGPKVKRQPQGLGLSVVSFKKAAGSAGRDLEVRVAGDPTVPWMGVLVRTKGQAPGGKVEDFVPLVFEADGTGVATLPGFDGSRDAWLVVSPQDQSLDPRDYTWSAALVDPEVVVEEEPKGCGCASRTSAVPWGWLAFAALWRRSRRGVASGPSPQGLV